MTIKLVGDEIWASILGDGESQEVAIDLSLVPVNNDTQSNDVRKIPANVARVTIGTYHDQPQTISDWSYDAGVVTIKFSHPLPKEVYSIYIYPLIA